MRNMLRSVELQDKMRVGTLPVLVLVVAVVAYLAVISFVPQAAAKPDDTWTRIETERVLRIGIDPSSPPFIVDDGSGNLSGFDVALANELANTWSAKIQYVYTGYDGLYDALNAKQFDLILSALPYNPFKTQDVYFSRAYFNGGPILIVPGEDTATGGLGNLQGKTIAVELGSNGDGVARRSQKRYGFTLQQFNSAAEALRALQTGQVSAAIVDPISFIDLQRRDASTKSWRVVGKPLADENYVIAVRRDSPTLLREVNRVIDTLRGNGRLEELQQEKF